MRHALPLLLLALPAAADTVPLDGAWTTAPAGVALAPACPPAFDDLATQMASMTARQMTEDYAWGGAFDPSRLPAFQAQGEGQSVTWTRDGAAWIGELVGPEGEAGTIRMTLEAPDRIAASVTMDVARMMDDINLAGCEIVLDFLMTHGG